ncbi:hypothetical protein RJ640_021066 [Escallonia rubra]|uniref:Retrovirus-related Pol polyprotein from transposon TNT 1-94 n=1 Tax=Escallonia rubra TaxID=112253 RepID=A0AA88R5P7_9ASTE|nr:hypothetical protein RJ640_021066 [Escallonia rubra]
MDEGSDLGDHILEFKRLVSRLSSIDVKLKEEDQAILLLFLLPKSYETLKTTLLIKKEILLVDDVMLAFMDSSRVNGTSSSNQGECLVERSWKRRERKDKKNRKKHVNNANVAEEDAKRNDGDLYLVSSVEQQENDFSRKVWMYFMKHKLSSGRLELKIRRGYTVEIKLHEQKIKSADESTDESIDEQSLEDPDEHPSGMFKGSTMSMGLFVKLKLFIQDIFIVCFDNVKFNIL